ncbi:hypothetical protein [Thermococcus sp. MAR1]|uniref:hypothetical protein n=1 Tax=Thermococcus sp. MAR1 TaxID=1638263 RepID=UPI00143AEC67|nr:hypothetical protein [Thermococcus sp. MAR1]NJE09600.1 hypothetical protein [Thermococcus sp. MAR1]
MSSVRRVTAWRMGYLSIGVIFVLIGVLVGHYVEELFGMFFGIFGLSLLFEACRKSALLVSSGKDEFKVIVRGRKPPFNVIIQKNGKSLWKGKVTDYVEVGNFSFDLVDGKLLVRFRGKPLGRLP